MPLKLPGGPARLRIASVVLAVVALLALRLPTNIVPILNVDEADFAVESGVLLDGGRPYVDFVEKKPPLIYVLYAGGLALVNGRIYVSYSGHFGDCLPYHGWVVGVSINNPADVMSWATNASAGGIWGHGGVASDGTNMFVITGNTFNTGGYWGGGEAIIRLRPGPVFSGNPTDYWAPTNWLSLDNGDIDLGGCGAVLIDVPGATPSQLALALGKDGKAYLRNRNNLGGITAPVASANVANYVTGQSAASYRTPQGTYFVFRNGSSAVSAYKITATNPPTIVPAWSVSQTGKGSPWVTTTDGTNNAIVWVVGAEGDQRLHGYNGDTGAVIYAGGGPNELMANTRKWNTGIVARARIYFAPPGTKSMLLPCR